MASLIREYIDLSEKHKKLVSTYNELKKEKDELLSKYNKLDKLYNDLLEKNKKECSNNTCSKRKQEPIKDSTIKEHIDIVEEDVSQIEKNNETSTNDETITISEKMDETPLVEEVEEEFKKPKRGGKRKKK